MAKASELRLEEMNRAVVAVLEPSPVARPNDPLAFKSQGRLWYRPLLDLPDNWQPYNLHEQRDALAAAESILCQDPARKEAYGLALAFEVTHRRHEWTYTQIADIATASDEARLRAMHAAVCGG